MEVHPPHHSLHSWRDFFVHIATIVVGLLIAIGLEQSVEMLHRRHLVHVAHVNLRAEARLNQAKFAENQRTMASTKTTLLRDLVLLRTIAKTPDAARDARLTAIWSWDSFETSAYDTARDTGAFAYMPYRDVQDIDSVYRQQQYVYTAMIEYVRAMYQRQQLLVGGRALADLSPAELTSVTDASATALTDLSMLSDLMRNLGEDYRELAAE